MKQQVVVLCGGISAEREVSKSSGRAVAAALSNAGYSVYTLDPALGEKGLSKGLELADGEIPKTPGFPALHRALGAIHRSHWLDRERCVIFNALHGTWGEDGRIQALLETLDFKFVGSGHLASALAMDKEIAKCAVRAKGVPTAKSILLTDRSTRNLDAAFFKRLPEVLALASPPLDDLIVKPNSQGSALGVRRVRASRQTEVKGAVQTALMVSDRVLLEPYLPGRELTVGILGDRALPIVAIVPAGKTYDYGAKYHSQKTRYFCPAPLPKLREIEIGQSALTAHRALGARHYSRVDFKLDNRHNFYFLELNTLPGMTATSLFPKAAQAGGLSLAQLCQELVQMAS